MAQVSRLSSPWETDRKPSFGLNWVTRQQTPTSVGASLTVWLEHAESAAAKAKLAAIQLVPHPRAIAHHLSVYGRP